jgi:hypothetical protein
MGIHCLYQLILVHACAFCYECHERAQQKMVDGVPRKTSAIHYVRGVQIPDEVQRNFVRWCLKFACPQHEKHVSHCPSGAQNFGWLLYFSKIFAPLNY